MKSSIGPGADFSSPAQEAIVQKRIEALPANDIDAHVVDTGDDARRLVLELKRERAEVVPGKSKPLHHAGPLQDLRPTLRWTARTFDFSHTLELFEMGHDAGRKHLGEGFALRFEDRSALEVRALIPSAIGTAAAGQS